MVVPQRAAERGAGVGRARRHPQPPHVAMLQDPGVGDAVEGDAARQAQVAHAVRLDEGAHAVQHDLLGDRLQREGHVAMPVEDRLAASARRPEGGDEPAPERAQLAEGVIAEIAHVDGVAAVGQRPDHVAEALDVGVLAVGGERHHLAFVAEAGKPQVLRDEGVDEAGRIHDARRPQAFEPVALAEIGAGRAVVAIAVHHQHERLLERRHEEDGGVRIVVRNVDDRRQRGGAEAAGEVAHQEVIEEYDIVLLRGVRAGQRQAEAQREAAQHDRRERPAQQPQVPRRGYAVDIAEIDAQVLEAGREGLLGELLRLLDAVEALFLEHQLGRAVLEEGNAAVVRLGYDPEYSQGSNTA